MLQLELMELKLNGKLKTLQLNKSKKNKKIKKQDNKEL
jgi:hypothetical protein